MYASHERSSADGPERRTQSRRRLTELAGAGLTVLLLIGFASTITVVRPTAAEDDTTSSQPEAVVLEPVADTYVSQAAPTTNFGTATHLFIEPGEFVEPAEIYLRFDVGNLPVGAQIISATLSAVAYDGWAFGGDGIVYVHFVAQDSWDETALAWDSRPSSAEVLGQWWLWFDGSGPEQIGSTRDGELRNAVQREATGDGMISFRLHSNGYRTHYRSREYADAATRPKLTIRFTRHVVVEAPSPSKLYGDPVPALEPTYIGMREGDDGPSTPAVCETSATSASPVGDYEVTCTGAADPNYTFAYRAGTLTVTKAPTRLVPKPLAPRSGDAPRSVSATLTTEAGVPISDEAVTFSADETEACTAFTDGDGVARCSPPRAVWAKFHKAGGVSATFAGSANYLASTGRAGTVERSK